MSAHAGPSQPIISKSLFGTTTGLLDRTQPQRLHHVPGSSLSFASFHPLVASSPHDISRIGNLSLNAALCRPKRVVIETIPGPNGGSYWRFVPRARREEGVEDEGSWPRVIDICGELVYCSQDQWDIYKLDPEYDCFVPAPPRFTVISRKKRKEPSGLRDFPSSFTDARTSSPRPNSKRSPPTPPSDKRPSAQQRKRFRPYVSDADSSDDGDDILHSISASDEEDDEEDEVEELVAGGFVKPRHGDSPFNTRHPRSREVHGGRGRKFHQDADDRQPRETAADFRNATNALEEDQEMIDSDMRDEWSTQTEDIPFTGTGKRKVSPTDEPSFRNRPSRSQDGSDHPSDSQETKRVRTRSPGAAIRQAEERRARREQRKLDRFRARAREWNEVLRENFLNSIMADVPEDFSYNDDADTSSEDPQTGENPYPANEANDVDEEALRQAAIEESRRKLAELERDKPLWEEAARQRRAAEQAEEEARRARKEAERRAAEAENTRRKQEAARAEAERQARAARERAAREQERRRNKHRDQKWSAEPWSTTRALDRYRDLCETFDNAKYTTSSPVTFDIIPWPVLRSPDVLTVEDIDWDAVEAFFQAVQPYMRTQDYKNFVEKSHKRFHPDRWRARGVLGSVEDEETRSCLEVAANTVAQALTPLWTDLKAT